MQLLMIMAKGQAKEMMLGKCLPHCYFTDLSVEFDMAKYYVQEGDCFRPDIRVTIPNGGMGLQCITVSGTVLPGEGKDGAGILYLFATFNTDKLLYLYALATESVQPIDKLLPV